MRIRIGNDFNVAWSIYRISAGNKVAEDLSTAKNLKLLLRNTRSTYCFALQPVINGNQLAFEVPVSKQQTGDYMLELSYDIDDATCSDGLRHITLDRDAFTIVDRSSKADATNSADLAINALQLTSEFAAGINGVNGLSAYEEAVKNGFVGDYNAWLDFLREPATAAAESANKAATDAAKAAGLADEAATAANKAATDAGNAAELAQAATLGADNAAESAGNAADAASAAATAANQAADNANAATTAAGNAAVAANQAAESAGVAAGAASDAANQANQAATEVRDVLGDLGDLGDVLDAINGEVI